MAEQERDYGRELYPFLYASSTGHVLQSVLAEVRQSTLQKCADVVALRGQLLADCADQVVDAAVAMADRFARGGKLLAFGNGGSATDAQDAAIDCMRPPLPGWRAIPALALAEAPAVVTALANDVGVEHVFSRQIGAFGARGDVALGISTSGGSPNVTAALAEARRRGLLTVALAGYDGGALRDVADFCLVARSEYVPRIQEGQATLWHALLEVVQARLAEMDLAVPGT